MLDYHQGAEMLTHRSAKGLTLIEMMIAIVIFSILLALAARRS